MARYPGWNILVATLVLSALAHALFLLAVSLAPGPSSPKLRVVTLVDVIDRLELPSEKSPAVSRPRFQAPLPDRFVTRPGHAGTRPGQGGDPAPAPRSLQMELPRSAPQAARPNEPTLSSRSTSGGVDRGSAFGDPDGVLGGRGEGGTGGMGPGGTGGSGDGGRAAPEPPLPDPPDTPLEILQAGTIDCKGCHDAPGTRPPPNRPGVRRGGQPVNVEQLAHTSGWNIGSPPPAGVEPIEVQFEYQLSYEGRVEKLRILKTSSDPAIAAALEHFAMMHEFTPPGYPATLIANYLFYPPPTR